MVLKNTLADPVEGLIVRPAWQSGLPLSIRCGPARRPVRRTGPRHQMPSRRIRNRAMRVLLFKGKAVGFHAKIFFDRRVMHRSCGEQIHKALLASMNNSGIAISRGLQSTEGEYFVVARRGATVERHRPVCSFRRRSATPGCLDIFSQSRGARQRW